MEKLMKLLTIVGVVLCVILCILTGVVIIQAGIILWISAVFIPSIVLWCLGIGLLVLPVVGIIVVVKGGN